MAVASRAGIKELSNTIIKHGDNSALVYVSKDYGGYQEHGHYAICPIIPPEEVEEKVAEFVKENGHMPTTGDISSILGCTPIPPADMGINVSIDEEGTILNISRDDEEYEARPLKED